MQTSSSNHLSIAYLRAEDYTHGSGFVVFRHDEEQGCSPSMAEAAEQEDGLPAPALFSMRPEAAHCSSS